MPASVPGRTAQPWGWHRLTDSWARRLVAKADVRPGELVLDIGAGHGALTAPLLAAGAHVVAVELHDYALQRGILVPRTAFVPPPARDSAVLVIRRR